MNRYINLPIILLLIILTATSLWCQTSQIKWDFIMPGSTMGWTATSDINGFKQQGGYLYGEVKGPNAHLLSPKLDLTPSNGHVIMIMMTSDKDGTGKVYWANTNEETDAGFKLEKGLEFKVIGDNKLHVYEVFPFWNKEGKIVRLRIDPPKDSSFSIDFIRILSLPNPTAPPTPQWNFYGGVRSWIPTKGIQDRGPKGTSWLLTAEPDSLILSPDVKISTVGNKWAAVRMTASSGKTARFLWVTDQESGANSVEFPIKPDGQMHTYNIEISKNEKWKGFAVRLGLIPSDESAEIVLDMVAVGPKRLGPAEIVVKTFGPPGKDYNAGDEAKVTVVLLNNGGKDAKDITVTLNLPKEVQLKSGELNQTVKELKSGEETTLEWTVVFKEAKEVSLELAVSGKEIPGVKEVSRINVTEKK